MIIREEEYMAKLILKTYYHDRYSGLVVADKPDIQDSTNGFGIEVVHAIDEKEIKKEVESSISHRDKSGILTGTVKEYCGPALDMEDHFVVIVDAFLTKLEKLKGYATFKYYDLFMFASLDMYDDILVPLCDKLVQLNINDKTFRFVYVYSQNELICFDLHNKTIKKMQVNTDMIDDLLMTELSNK